MEFSDITDSERYSEMHGWHLLVSTLFGKPHAAFVTRGDARDWQERNGGPTRYAIVTVPA